MTHIVTYLLCPFVLFIGIVILSPKLPVLHGRDVGAGFKPAPTLPKWIPWIPPLVYAILFGMMTVLKYRSFHTTIMDLGVFDNAVWRIAHFNEYYRLSFGHFQPVLYLYALLYRLWPSALTLTLAQTLAVASGAYPLYLIARKHLRDDRSALAIVLAYLLYPPVEYNTLFDFHTDHLIIPLMLWGFYVLEIQSSKFKIRNFIRRGYSIAFVLISSACLLIKEPLMLSVAMLGVYAVVRNRMYKSGFFVFAFSLLMFFFATEVVIPRYTGKVYGGGFEGSFDYLGRSIPEIVRTLVRHPLILIGELGNAIKLSYFFFIFAPLLFIPLLSPIALLPALPSLSISFLSHIQNYYDATHHYTASVIPAAFVALIYGIEKLQSIGQSNPNQPPPTSHQPQCEVRSAKCEVRSAKCGVRSAECEVRSAKCEVRNALYALRSLWFRFSKSAIWAVLMLSLYFNVVLSPSPISLDFWARRDKWLYHKTAYIVTDRDRVLRDALKKYIPADPDVSVSSQNTVNIGHLAHRKGYHLFPEEMETADYVVLDTRRPHFVFDRVFGMEAVYHEKFEEVLAKRELLFQQDGIYIFGR